MAESFTVTSYDAGDPAFNLTGGPQRGERIPVVISNGLPADAWSRVSSSPLFAEWTANFCMDGRMRLECVTIEKLKPEICLTVEATLDGTRVTGPVVLRPMQASVLLVLRNTQARFEVCVFVKRADVASGLGESLGLVEGTFDENGKFTGHCAALLEEHMQLSLQREDLVDLSRAAHGPNHSKAGLIVCPAPGAAATIDAFSTPVRTELLLYRCTASPEALIQLEKKLGRTKRHGHPPGTLGSVQQSPKLGLSVVYMGDTWRATLDPRAMAALFLLVESRYHQVKLLTPSGEEERAIKGNLKAGGVTGNPKREAAGPMAIKKAAAHFCKVSSLTPLRTGVNLRVKVVEPIKREPDLVLPRGKVVQRGTMVVGDEDAIITVNLEGSQLDLPDVVNTPLLIRNGRIKMEDGHMRLVVDRWGKISDARGEDFSDFNFSVCTVVDISATEYELVELTENEQDSADSASYPYPARGRAMGGRRRVMAGEPHKKGR